VPEVLQGGLLQRSLLFVVERSGVAERAGGAVIGAAFAARKPAGGETGAPDGGGEDLTERGGQSDVSRGAWFRMSGNSKGRTQCAALVDPGRDTSPGLVATS
jgi:hypothetical protein